MSRRRNSGMWDYLDSIGILEKGSDAEIKAAKKAYRKGYLLRYKQKQRTTKPEFIIHLKKDNGEYKAITEAAKSHKMTTTSFLRKACLSYLSKRYIVPDIAQVAKLEQLLSECLNEIQNIARQKQRHFWDRNDKLEMIEKRITILENDIDRLFRNPPMVEKQNDSENKIS